MRRFCRHPDLLSVARRSRLLYATSIRIRHRNVASIVRLRVCPNACGGMSDGRVPSRQAPRSRQALPGDVLDYAQEDFMANMENRGTTDTSGRTSGSSDWSIERKYWE